MMPHHARRVNAMTRDAIDYLMFYFNCRDDLAELPSVLLAEQGIGQPDVVMALLVTDDERMLACAEFLVGRFIERCPAMLRTLPVPSTRERPDLRSPDRRVVTAVTCTNPRLGRTAKARFMILRPGMTVDQYVVRGGTKRDVLMAERKGWISLTA